MNPYEADGLTYAVDVTATDPDGDPLPELAWAQCLARNRQGDVVTGATQISGATITIAFAPFALATGVWEIQLRAGATEAAARTVHAARWTILDSIATQP